MLPVLLTVKEVAERLGVAESAVYAQIQRGVLPAIKITARAIRVLESEFETYLNPAGPELTVPEAARHLKLSHSEVYKLIRERRLPALVRGKSRRRILKRDLVEYINNRPGAADRGMQAPAP